MKPENIIDFLACLFPHVNHPTLHIKGENPKVLPLHDQTSLCFVRTDVKPMHLNKPHYKLRKANPRERQRPAGQQQRGRARPRRGSARPRGPQEPSKSGEPSEPSNPSGASEAGEP